MKRAGIVMINGSPLLEVDGRPAAWFENWILNDPRHLMIIAPRQAGKNTLARRWAETREHA